MRKFLLLFAATLMAATSAWTAPNLTWHAQYGDSYEQVDSIPAPTYIKNIYIDKDLFLYFDDTYKQGEDLNREYTIVIYLQTENSHIYKINNPVNISQSYIYEYGEELNGSGGHFIRYTKLYTKHEERRISRGGNIKVGSGFGSMITELYEAGITDIRVAIEAESTPTGGGKCTHYEDELTVYEGHTYGSHLNSGADIKLPKIRTLNISAPSEVKYGEQLLIEGTIKAVNKVNYKIQESFDYVYDTENYTWQTLKSGSLTTAEAREGKTVQYKRVFTGNGVERIRLYCLIVTDVTNGVSDTSQVEQVAYKYSWVFNDGAPEYYGEGEGITLPKPADCHEYSWNSEWPVGYGLHGDFIEYSMPACNVWFYDKPKKYTVKFLNADYTLLKTVEVDCGSDAGEVAPTPTMGDYTFIGWNKDLTNVHSSFSAVAKYDIGNDYYLNVNMTDHKNEVFPFAGFVDNETRAMVGDKITLRSSVFATTPATLYYETAPWNNTEQRFLWDPNSGRKVADYTDPNQERFFDQEITIAYDANTQFIHPFEYKTGVRFYLMIAGVKVYSDPVEIDIYYPMTINSLSGEEIYAENTAGDHIQSLSAMLPARNDDTVRVYGNNGADGGCLSFARVLYSSRPLDSGLDEDGKAYFLCPGEQETINVDATKKLIVFDGVYGNGYPKQLDFTAEGFGKINGYYGEVVTCGGSIQNMPDDPTEEGAIFNGWQAWNNDYENDDYLHVPAIDDNILGFTAQFEYLPEVPQYQVRFYGKDGDPLLKDTLINEGENAVPPVAPEVSGFHFVGWDKPFTTITANTDITALYGEDAVIWTVTYKNWDNSDLGTEQVNDGEAAKGVVAIREGYTFTGWSEDISSVKSNMTVTAQFAVSVYTITYTMDGAAIMSEQVNHGDMPTAYQAIEEQGKPSTEQYVYTFDHWNPAIVAATEDATYEAVFAQALRKYTVRFQNWDHSLIDEQQVEYGKAAQAPADPTREGYTFTGWDREFNNIIADMTVTALFEKSKEQGIEQMTNHKSQMTNKFLRNGVLLIERNGKTYNAQGAEVR